MPHVIITQRLAINTDLLRSSQNARDRVKDFIIEGKKLRAIAEKINEGKENEENTVDITWELCNHNIGQPCVIKEDIDTLTVSRLSEELSKLEPEV